VGILLWYRSKSFLNSAVHTKGTVLEVRKVTSENKGTYSPYVRFTANDGRVIEFLERSSSYPPKYKAGDDANVFYNPANPNKARALMKSSDLYFSAKIFGGIGGGLLFLQVFILVVFLIVFYLTGPLKMK
jgi:hypothetical protein